MRKIAIVTTTRADYGLLFWLMKAIKDDPELELQVFASGTHLSKRYGETIKQIEADQFSVTEKIDMPLEGDSEREIAAAMGHATIGFANAFEKHRPDILVVLGDRHELIAAVAKEYQGIGVRTLHY